MIYGDEQQIKTIIVINDGENKNLYLSLTKYKSQLNKKMDQSVLCVTENEFKNLNLSIKFDQRNRSDFNQISLIPNSQYSKSKDPYTIYEVKRDPEYNAIRQSANLYVYSINNPITYIDPTGELAWIPILKWVVKKVVVKIIRNNTIGSPFEFITVY